MGCSRLRHGAITVYLLERVEQRWVIDAKLEDCIAELVAG